MIWVLAYPGITSTIVLTMDALATDRRSRLALALETEGEAAERLAEDWLIGRWGRVMLVTTVHDSELELCPWDDDDESDDAPTPYLFASVNPDGDEYGLGVLAVCVLAGELVEVELTDAGYRRVQLVHERWLADC